MRADKRERPLGRVESEQALQSPQLNLQVDRKQISQDNIIEGKRKREETGKEKMIRLDYVLT